MALPRASEVDARFRADPGDPGPGRPAFVDQFTRWADRELPPHHCVERKYPGCWWRGSGGVDRAAVQALFGTL